MTTTSTLPAADNDVDALQQRIAELEQAVRARDDFLAVAAHELRSPLNGLALRLAVLEKLAGRGADARLIEEIRRTRRNADRYVRRAVVLLDVTRLNAGKMEPVPEPVSIAALVAQVADAHADEAAFHRIALTHEAHGDAVGYWDAHMAEQILSNLVVNAIKHGAGSAVTIRALTGGGQAIFEVADGGPGIDPRHQQRIFERFERLVPTQPSSGGYGLGLWIVGRLVASHKGTIEIESAPGQGALFRVRLPLGSPADLLE